MRISYVLLTFCEGTYLLEVDFCIYCGAIATKISSASFEIKIDKSISHRSGWSVGEISSRGGRM